MNGPVHHPIAKVGEVTKNGSVRQPPVNMPTDEERRVMEERRRRDCRVNCRYELLLCLGVDGGNFWVERTRRLLRRIKEREEGLLREILLYIGSVGYYECRAEPNPFAKG